MNSNVTWFILLCLVFSSKMFCCSEPCRSLFAEKNMTVQLVEVIKVLHDVLKLQKIEESCIGLPRYRANVNIYANTCKIARQLVEQQCKPFSIFEYVRNYPDRLRHMYHDSRDEALMSVYSR